MVYLLLFIKIQFSEPSCWVITPARYNLVPTIGIEPKVYRLSADCSTIELHGYNFGTEDWTRTNHTQIFSLLLYLMSYFGIQFSLGSHTRIELVITESQPVVLPLN